MNIPTERILQCNQSKPLADANVRIVDLMNENALKLERGQFKVIPPGFRLPPGLR